MSQRESGYERKERDLYETPEWVTMALLNDGLRKVDTIWEPACGSGKMVRALSILDCEIVGSDIETGTDFLSVPAVDADAIITNPPYAHAEAFIRRAIDHVQPFDGFVAMLLRTDFDHAKTRQYLFGGCPQFARKLVLTKRIQWFEDSKGSPSFNHAWFIWDWQHEGAPILTYGPMPPADQPTDNSTPRKT